MSLVISKEERKAQVIKLYREAHTYREIAKLARMSIRDISRIIREYRGEAIESVKEKSMASKAFQLFLDEKSLVEVAIELDLPASEVETIHDDFVRLRYQHLIPQHYHEIKPHIPNFLQYYKAVNNPNIKGKNKPTKIIDNNYIISQQENRIHQLDLENEKSLEFKMKLEIDIQKLKSDYEFYGAQY